MELPPRARRILIRADRIMVGRGTTSACAENTRWWAGGLRYRGNYLRVRGEYTEYPLMIEPTPELPPRARRILRKSACSWWKSGTTSACAENTGPKPEKRKSEWNYLRVRGEYAGQTIFSTPPWELPPRARRILGAGASLATSHGTTTACAENTFTAPLQSASIRNYLRVRGEYPVRHKAGRITRELPPRARRIPAQLLHAYRIRGTTSACAENTPCSTSAGSGMWNYLRVRGEYRKWLTAKSSISELPPRARRIREIRRSNFMGGGTTSACAENTQLCGPGSGYPGNYLRVRGEYGSGSANHPEPGGTTSACAENTPNKHKIPPT